MREWNRQQFRRIAGCAAALLVGVAAAGVRAALTPTPPRGSAVVEHASQPQGPYDWARWREFWAFKPVVKPAAPHVANQAWVRNPIDAFVLARLERSGLSPAPEADKATLIRRVTFDLTGLPPTPRELRGFLSDKSPDAWEKLVDRLLTSPHYGEKWGRHWLDVARYVPGRISFPGIEHTSGDSLYRDYVVRAFNEDKPYDRFVIEQLAGDLLPASADRQQECDQITAPAFLSIGPWFDMCTDPNRLRMEMIDDQITVTGQAFLGLSINCARCHDHKFDPIPTADYYALAGIFGSTRIVGDFSEYWRDGRVRLLRPLAMPDEVAANDRIRRQIDAIAAQRWAFLTDSRATLLKQWQRDAARYRAAAAKMPLAFIKRFEAEDHDGFYNLRVGERSRDGKVVQVLETLKPEYQWVKYKFELPADGTYRIDALFSAEEKSPLTVQANGEEPITGALNLTTGGWDVAHQRWATLATLPLRKGLNFLRLERKQGEFPRLDKFRLYRIDDDFDARIAQVAREQNLNPMVLADFVKNGVNSASGAEVGVGDSAAGAIWPTVAGIGTYLDEAGRHSLAEFDAKIAALQKRIVPHALIVSVTDQPHPADMPIHVRGAVEATGGAPVPRGVPQLLEGALPRPEIAPGRSGRLELARWIVDRRNPLAARVMANRIWQWHFGHGIVRTPSDFGSRGAAPTHPQLLDWLAATFMENGWSIKKLHRMILLSSTYRMSASPSERALRIDPDDRQLSYFAPRRLEAEELFDSMFSSTNVLIHQPSGQPLNLEKSKGRAMYVLTTNRAPPGLGAEVRKMLMLFDFDMSGASIDQRTTSNTAAQSLFWLNNPLPKYYAAKFADRLLKMDRLNDARRLEQAYLIAFSHAPDPRISQLTLAYLDQLVSAGETRKDAWTKICQAIYASDEFHYVR